MRPMPRLERSLKRCNEGNRLRSCLHIIWKKSALITYRCVRVRHI